MRQNKLGIVLVSYKNPKRTIEYVTTQLPRIGGQYDVCVVNNSSTLKECERIAQATGGMVVDKDGKKLGTEGDGISQTKVFVVHSPENLGYARGNNLGVKVLEEFSKFDYFLLTNDDITIPKDFKIQDLISIFTLHKDIGVVGPRVIGSDNRDQSPHRRVITPERQIGWMLFSKLRKQSRRLSTTEEVAGGSKIGNPPEEGKCYWVSGCFFLVSSEVWKKADGMDSRTFLYAEEPIFAERLKKLGYQEYYIPTQRVYHAEGSTTSAELSDSSKRQLIVKSNCIYYRDYLKSNPLSIWLYRKLANRR